MATTTNFGWETPDDTDLVKDGAAAIRTALGGVDTSFVDLKGGTSGQILSKASNTDLDFTWITNDVGDITAVSAGTGISGGGTSGAVTITNSMATAIDAKGDLIAGTAADAFDRLAVGTNGQVLTADSTTATGLKWATASSTPTAVGCYVYKNGSNQSIANTTVTNITFQSEQFDTNSLHDNVTNNSRITIPTGYAGKYQINANINFAGNSTGDRELYIYVNNTAYYCYNVQKGTTSLASMQNSVIVNLAAGDYVEIKVWQDSGGALNVLSDYNCNFSVGYLGA